MLHRRNLSPGGIANFYAARRGLAHDTPAIPGAEPQLVPQRKAAAQQAARRSRRRSGDGRLTMLVLADVEAAADLRRAGATPRAGAARLQQRGRRPAPAGRPAAAGGSSPSALGVAGQRAGARAGGVGPTLLHGSGRAGAVGITQHDQALAEPEQARFAQHSSRAARRPRRTHSQAPPVAPNGTAAALEGASQQAQQRATTSQPAQVGRSCHRQQAPRSSAFSTFTAACFSSGCFEVGAGAGWLMPFTPGAGRRCVRRDDSSPQCIGREHLRRGELVAGRHRQHDAARGGDVGGSPSAKVQARHVLRVHLERRLGHVAEQAAERAGAAHAVPLVAQPAGVEREGVTRRAARPAADGRGRRQRARPSAVGKRPSS